MKLQRQIDQLLAQRASEWHQILQSADDAQRAEFVAWLKQSPLHVKEYLETTYTDRLLGHLDPAKHADVDALLAQAQPTVVPFAGAKPAAPAARPRSPRRFRLTALAAGVALCALSGALAYKQFWSGARYTTAIGEQRTVQLADNSIVMLNADSKIAVRFDDHARDIELLQGEALFTVARDARRPFRVQTRSAVVQAVGTAFNVYERPDGVRVSVLEGRVKITPQDPHPGTNKTAQHLDAGQEARIRPDGALQLDVRADVARTLAWRERRLIFVDTPLEEMVREFNRYSATRLVLDGVPPGTHHYNGIFNASDPESLAALLSREPDLVVERKSGEILIRRR